ncbi:hypothetical protein ASD64_16375 [Mesorhizobium sp. Root157]|nr:hypothetical protein ASD64_16375 [Mesorhizobium sp. Root157]
MTCVPFLSDAVQNPSHAGQSPLHKNDGFELVKEVRASGLIVLVSIYLKPSNNGIYFATSTYPLDEKKLTSRLKKGHLFEL